MGRRVVATLLQVVAVTAVLPQVAEAMEARPVVDLRAVVASADLHPAAATVDPPAARLPLVDLVDRPVPALVPPVGSLRLAAR